MDKLGTAVIAIICAILATILSGFVLTQLWAWFIVPLGVPAIGIAHGIGLSLVASMLTLRTNATTVDHKWYETMGISIACSLLFWGMGALVALFM
jgi:hypothetical protein